MPNIHTEIARIKQAKTDISTAIAEKHIVVPQDVKIDELPELVKAIPSGISQDITFYDYDGTPLYAYTFEDIQKLSKLPALPTHEGLVGQGWNWTLEELKSVNHKCVVGANYITDDGKTRLYANFVLEGPNGITLYYYQSMAWGVVIDWGDGTQDSVGQEGFVHLGHTYSSKGDYLITMTPHDNCELSFGGTPDDTPETAANQSVIGIVGENISIASSSITKVEIGKNVTRLKKAAFSRLFNLLTITIPSTITQIDSHAFRYCRTMRGIVIPRGVTYLSNFLFYDDGQLRMVSLPKNIKTIGKDVFRFNLGLEHMTLSNEVERIDDLAFQDCYSLLEINLCDKISYIGDSVFKNCYSIRELRIPEKVTTLTGNASLLRSLLKLTLPSGLTSICTFDSTRALREVELPNSITALPDGMFASSEVLTQVKLPNNLQSIGKNAFTSCHTLTTIKYPSTLNYIGELAFQYTGNLMEHDFSQCKQVPTLANVNVFQYINDNCKIKVPSALYNQWKTATNWSVYANYMVAV